MSSPYLLILWLCSGVGCWSRIKGGGSIVLNNWPSFSILIWSLEGLEGGGSVKRLFFFENFAKSWKKFFSLKLLPGKLLRFEWPLEMDSWENELPLLLAWSSLSTPKDGGGYFGGVFFHAKKNRENDCCWFIQNMKFFTLVCATKESGTSTPISRLTFSSYSM